MNLSKHNIFKALLSAEDYVLDAFRDKDFIRITIIIILGVFSVIGCIFSFKVILNDLIALITNVFAILPFIFIISILIWASLRFHKISYRNALKKAQERQQRLKEKQIKDKQNNRES